MAAVHAVLGVVVGSILQPRMLGSRLGLSPLVVLLSLVIWGYLLGVAGMFFAVPLTIIVKIVLDSTDDLRSLSVLLGDAGAAREAEKR
jgi:AI-2 transport protein TqsA